MTGFWLSRARLRRDTPAVAALAPLLIPSQGPARFSAGHHLVWHLLSDSASRERDFLWREEAPGQFMILSARPPIDRPELFALETKPFEPVLAAGDTLGFTLRANPVVSQPQPGGKRGKRQDVVMHALHPVPKGQRAPVRLDIATEAGRAWLGRQGSAHGFEPLGEVGVDGYETVRIPRSDGKADAQFGRLDFTGRLTVTDPAAFLPALMTGFGRARAFGCGLMLIRRA